MAGEEDPEDLVSVGGPVEFCGDELALRIPLAAGGERLAPLATKIGRVEDGYLVVVIQPWLAEKLRLSAGSRVIVDNRGGKFNITRSGED